MASIDDSDRPSAVGRCVSAYASDLYLLPGNITMRRIRNHNWAGIRGPGNRGGWGSRSVREVARSRRAGHLDNGSLLRAQKVYRAVRAKIGLQEIVCISSAYAFMRMK